MMNELRWVLLTACLLCPTMVRGQTSEGVAPPRSKIVVLDPPEKDFFSKTLDFHGIPIKAHNVVDDEALYAAWDRLSLMFTNLLTRQPMVISNLVAAGAALHIIGRDQVTTDLPEWRHDKGVARPEYNGLTRDQRTRGMGGRLTSCGEENLLKLEKDRYRGRDICLHEFAHNVRNNGIQREVRGRFDAQHKRSLAKGLWQKSYAGSSPDEFFAELTMWYFGTRGDRHMTGPKPKDGPEGLREYDPEAFALMDDFYGGRIEITQAEPRRQGRRAETGRSDSSRSPRSTATTNDAPPIATAESSQEDLRAPSPFNGERAGVRGGNAQRLSSTAGASDVRPTSPQPSPPLRGGEGDALRARLKNAITSGEWVVRGTASSTE